MKKTEQKYQAFVQILKEELIPAMGCTEPISLAYGASIARKVLNHLPTKIVVEASGSIIKNVKSVIVPHTHHLKGIKAAVCAGIIGGNADKYLEVLSQIDEKTKKEINVLGKTGSGNKSTGWKGTGKITIYKNTSIFDELMERYKNTGEDVYFDIQVSNEDPTSAAGVCTMVFMGCNVDGGVLASFDVDGDFLKQEINFTFEDFSNPTKFKQLAGMQ